jgi:plastocyanin
MSRRKYARFGVAAVALILAAAVAVPAFAGSLPSQVTQKIINRTKFVPNRYIQEGLRFKLDRINIRKGGTVTLVDTSKEEHTFSLVKKSQVPGTIRQLEACFSPQGVCGKIGVRHGAINPDTGEEQEPTTPLVDVGKAGFNQPGDSVIVPGGKRVKVKVTSAQALYYICAIHPWMQGAINGRPAHR